MFRLQNLDSLDLFALLCKSGNIGHSRWNIARGKSFRALRLRRGIGRGFRRSILTPNSTSICHRGLIRWGSGEGRSVHWIVLASHSLLNISHRSMRIARSKGSRVHFLSRACARRIARIDYRRRFLTSRLRALFFTGRSFWMLFRILFTQRLGLRLSIESLIYRFLNLRTIIFIGHVKECT